LEEKRKMKDVIYENKSKMSEMERRMVEKEKEMNDEKKMK
jgi:hypothetical protein